MGQTPQKCHAVTQKGTPCKRPAISGDLFCKTHQESTDSWGVKLLRQVTAEMDSANLAVSAGTIHHAKRMISTYLANTKQELLGNREALLIKIETTKRLSPILYNYLKANHIAPASTQKDPKPVSLTTKEIKTTSLPDSSKKANIKKTKDAGIVEKGQEDSFLNATKGKSSFSSKLTFFAVLVAALAGLGFFLREA